MLPFGCLLRICLIGFVFLQISCAHLAADRLVHPSNTKDSVSIFGVSSEEWDHLAGNLFSWQGFTGIDENGSECVPLYGRLLPAGHYPHEYQFELTTSGFSLVDFRVSISDLVGARHEPRGTIVLVHGWGIDSSLLVGHALFLAEAGYDVFLLDLPAHGRSKGERFSWGRHEPLHFACAIGWLDDEFSPLPPVILYGQSTGALISLGAAALGVRADGIIALSTPADPVQSWEWAYRNAAPRWVRLVYPIRDWQRVRDQVYKLSGGPIQKSVLRSMILGLDIPVLYLHGSKDRHVPKGHSLWLNEHTPNSQISILDNRSHVGIVADREGTLLAVSQWLEQFGAYLGANQK